MGFGPVSHLSPHLRPGRQWVLDRFPTFGDFNVTGPGENEFSFWLSDLPAYHATAPAWKATAAAAA